MNAGNSFGSKQRGFSLIDAMIAAVVLATGLLALAALQANITRNTADARARSQIVAYVEEIAERQRAFGVNTDFSGVPVADLWDDTTEWAAVGAAAGVSNLELDVTSVHYDGRSGSFVPLVAAGIKTTDPQYKILRTVATWNDASGQGRSLEMTSVLSPRVTGSSMQPLNIPTGGSGSTSARPTIRSESPVVEGMIPIAIGGTDGNTTDTAATNPKPLIATDRNRTSYEVLTYSNGADCIRTDLDGCVQQQRKVETAVINCTCSINAAPTDTLNKYPQWPVYWDGYRYTAYVPKTNVDPPGKAAATGPKANSNQDALCTECCRDHHDTSNATHVKFDPFRTNGHNHYKIVSGQFVDGTDEYLESCRMIRVDGFWRTAQDLQLKHFDLLKTQDSAKDTTPDTDAAANYQIFAKNFLKANYVPYVPVDPAVSNEFTAEAIALYALDATKLFEPENIDIDIPYKAIVQDPKTPNKTIETTVYDYRFLHARGLYVDKVEPSLQAIIKKAYDNCGYDNKEECVLPLLAFTSINLTEAAYYYPTNPTSGALAVTSLGFVEYLPDKQNRGRVNALVGSDGVAFISPKILTSNSGLAVSDKGIDPEDAVFDEDADNDQKFTIGGDGSGGGGGGNKQYKASVVWADYTFTGTSPTLSWSIGGSGTDCTGTVYPLNCDTSSTLPAEVTTTVSKYNVKTQNTAEWQAFNGQITCSKKNAVDKNFTVNIAAGTLGSRPVCKVFTASATGFSPQVSGSLATEVTSFTGTVQPNATVTITLTDSGAADIPAAAEAGQGYTCAYNGPNYTLIWDKDPCTQTTFDP